MFKSKTLTLESDKIGSLKTVELLKGIIESENEYLQKENVVALYGNWGSGKSSIIDTLIQGEEKYKLKNGIKAVKFEAWENELDSNLSLSLFETLLKETEKIDETNEKDIELIKNSLRLVKGIVKGISINTPFVSFSGDKLVEELEKKEEKPVSGYSKREAIKEKYNDIIDKIVERDQKLVVFIDDLDRCENENILTLLRDLKHLFSLTKKIIFIVAVDKDGVSRALESKYGNDSEKAEEYLEKIFPINLSLKGSFSYETILNELSEKIIDIKEKKNVLKVFEKYKVNTPRKFNIIKSKLILFEVFNKQDLKNKDYLIIIYLIVISQFEGKHFKIFLEKYKQQKEGINSKLFEMEGITTEDSDNKSNFGSNGKLQKNIILSKKNPLHELNIDENDFKYIDTLLHILSYKKKEKLSN